MTDSQGAYRIVDLRPGPYVVTFTCPASTHSGGRTSICARNSPRPSTREMAVGALEETITVSGEAPLVDTRSARAQTQFDADTLEALPGTGRLSTLISVLPGAVLNNEGDRASGNLSDRTQTRFSIHGAPNAQPVIDGMNTEMAASNTGVLRLELGQLPGGGRRDQRHRRRPRHGRRAAEHDPEGRRQRAVRARQHRVLGSRPAEQQHQRRADCPRPRQLDARAGVDQEVHRGDRRARRPDQAGSALVLRRRAEERDAAVRGRHLLQCAQAARKHALRARLEPPGVQQRLLPRLQPPFDDAGDGKTQGRGLRLVPAQLQLRLRVVPSAGRVRWSIPQRPRSTNTNRPST